MTRKCKTAMILLSVLAVAGIILYIVFAKWMNASSVGNIQIGSPASQTAADKSPVQINTPYFTAQLPHSFSVKRRSETTSTGGTLLQLFATGGQNKQQDIAITVGTLPPDGLSGVGDYNLRISQPVSYERFDPGNLPAGAVAYRATDGPPAFVVFWPTQPRYTELSFTGEDSSTLQQLQAIYEQVIGSWRTD